MNVRDPFFSSSVDELILSFGPIISKGLKPALFSTVLLFLVGGILSPAATITFTFNSLANGTPATGGMTATSSIQNYMNNQVATSGISCTTSISGCVIVGSGAVADHNTYTADNHIVGPGTGGTSLTLGNTESGIAGSVDTYIRNIGGASAPNDRITMSFIGLKIYSISFDYEIFPDGSTSQPPDFTFTATDSSNNVVSTWTQYGVAPGTNGTYAYSPACQQGKKTAGCGVNNVEPNAQLLGTWSANFATGVSNLSFVDWPATIGIDNLKIATAPEPGSLLLLGTACLGLFYLKKKNAKQKT
jgi:hypothetical protein